MAARRSSHCCDDIRNSPIPKSFKTHQPFPDDALSRPNPNTFDVIAIRLFSSTVENFRLESHSPHYCDQNWDHSNFIQAGTELQGHYLRIFILARDRDGQIISTGSLLSSAKHLAWRFAAHRRHIKQGKLRSHPEYWIQRELRDIWIANLAIKLVKIYEDLSSLKKSVKILSRPQAHSAALCISKSLRVGIALRVVQIFSKTDTIIRNATNNNTPELTTKKPEMISMSSIFDSVR